MKKKKVVLKAGKAAKKAVNKFKAVVKKHAEKAVKKNAKKVSKAVKSSVPVKRVKKPEVKEKVVLPQQVEWIIKCLYDRKSEDIRLFDVSKTAGLWEYYVICSGASGVHVSALRDNLKKEMGEKGFFKSHEDRDPDNKWIVVDFGNILVHIFEKETRARFALETTLGPTEVPLKGIIKG